MMKTCDICKEPELVVYYDAKTKDGPWADMCSYCFATYGLGLGTGLGQRYAWDGNKYGKEAG